MPSLHVNGYDMAFVERGTGVPLVLVHGTLGDYRTWALQMEPFGAHCRTIAVSLRHCWPERWDGEGDDFTVQQHTEDVAAFIAALDGGVPSISSVIPAEGTSPSGSRKTSPISSANWCWRSRAARWTQASSRHTRRKARRSRLGRFTPRPPHRSAAVRSTRGWSQRPRSSTARAVGRTCRKRESSRCGTTPARCWGQIKEQRAPFSRADAEAIRAPTLLMAGERSPENFHRILDGLESALRDVRRVVIPNASHGSSGDNPKRFEREVLAFLKDLERRTFK
jgi:esterase